MPPKGTVGISKGFLIEADDLSQPGLCRDVRGFPRAVAASRGHGPPPDRLVIVISDLAMDDWLEQWSMDVRRPRRKIAITRRVDLSCSRPSPRHYEAHKPPCSAPTRPVGDVFPHGACAANADRPPHPIVQSRGVIDIDAECYPSRTGGVGAREMAPQACGGPRSQTGRLNTSQ
jgi:hypothetical protein